MLTIRFEYPKWVSPELRFAYDIMLGVGIGSWLGTAIYWVLRLVA